MSVMNKVLFFLSVVSFGVAIYVATEECPPNEEYLLCGSTCPPNCTNLELHEVCSTDCVEGCFCVVGFVRHDNGSCVTPDQCDLPTNTTCPENEEYLDCGPSCFPTCEVPEPPPCDLACRDAGCFCMPGFLRSGEGCVSADLCPTEQCLFENEVFGFSAHCQPSCQDPQPACTKIAVPGCMCDGDLLRDDSGNCIPAEKCPKNATGGFSEYVKSIEKLLHLQ